MRHINEQWESLRTIAQEMVKDAAEIAIAEYRGAYAQDATVRSPHLPAAVAARVMAKLDDLFYQASKILREEEEAQKSAEVKSKSKTPTPQEMKERRA